MSLLAENLKRVEERVQRARARVGRERDQITLIAVTKTVSLPVIEEALSLGITHIGENRVQEARSKLNQLPADCTRHLIGTLQRNKVGKALELFDLIQSVDRVPLVEEISRRIGRGSVEVLLQVNVSGEASKHGMRPDELPRVAQAASEAGNLHVRGLMTIAPYDDDPEAARPTFARLRALSNQLRQLGLPRVEADVLSMGMSHDFEIAIEEGATHIRVGSALFGERN